MNNYMIVELNNNKYIIIDIIDNNEKKYFLLSQVIPEENTVTNEFDICIYNEEKNNFETIEDEFEYNVIKDIFDKKLNKIQEELNKSERSSIANIIKLKVIDINDYKYTLENNNGILLEMDIELFGNFKIQVNDYIYILEETTKEKITVRFGPIYTNDIELVKIIRGEKSYYLQRYYG